MVDVRAIEARLTRDVEHKVLSDLGYAEWSVTLPSDSGVALDPRPQVVQLSAEAKGRWAAVLTEAQKLRAQAHDRIWKLEIPRTVGLQRLHTFGNWVLQHDEMLTPIECQLIEATLTDSVWMCYVGNVNEVN